MHFLEIVTALCSGIKFRSFLVLIFGEYQEFELQKISSFWKILGFFENKEIKLPIANALLGDSYSTVFWDQV